MLSFKEGTIKIALTICEIFYGFLKKCPACIAVLFVTQNKIARGANRAYIIHISFGPAHYCGSQVFINCTFDLDAAALGFNQFVRLVGFRQCNRTK